MCDHWSNATIARSKFTKFFFSLDWFCIASIFGARFIWAVAYVIWIYDLSLRLWLLCNFKGNFNLNIYHSVFQAFIHDCENHFRFSATRKMKTNWAFAFKATFSIIEFRHRSERWTDKILTTKKIYFIKRCGEPMECSNVSFLWCEWAREN